MLVVFFVFNWSQDNSNGTFQGDFNYAQSYYEDPTINAEKVDEFLLMNLILTFVIIKATLHSVCVSKLLNVLQGFESNFNGNGIPIDLLSIMIMA